MERPRWVEAYRDQCAEFEHLVFPLLDKDRRAAAKRLFGDVETLVDFKPALLHADLLPEHLLVRDGRLAGVIDWGDARVGDPALDYAWLLDGPFTDWDVDPDLRRRVGLTAASHRGTRRTTACSQTGRRASSAAWPGSRTASECDCCCLTVPPARAPQPL